MGFCPNCGIGLQPEAFACPNCGKPLDVEPLRVSYGSALPVPENLAAVLAYFVIPAIVFLFVAPFRRNHFVRFHSVQALLTTAAIVVCTIALSIVSTIVNHVPYIGAFLVLLAWPLFALAGFLLWLLMLYKAYANEEFKLPFVGEIAETQAATARQL